MKLIDCLIWISSDYRRDDETCFGTNCCPLCFAENSMEASERYKSPHRSKFFGFEMAKKI